MKPKAALVKSGDLPPGSENKRGRMSAAQIAKCKELAAQGWDIEGFSVSKSTTSKPVVEKVKPDPERVYDIPDVKRPEGDWEAFTVDAKPASVGMRTCCLNCGNSLTYCFCKVPVVWVDHETMRGVEFKPRTSPVPNKRY